MRPQLGTTHKSRDNLAQRARGNAFVNSEHRFLGDFDHTLSARIDTGTFSLRDVRCRKRLGGLLKHYERVEA